LYSDTTSKKKSKHKVTIWKMDLSGIQIVINRTKFVSSNGMVHIWNGIRVSGFQIVSVLPFLKAMTQYCFTTLVYGGIWIMLYHIRYSLSLWNLEEFICVFYNFRWICSAGQRPSIESRTIRIGCESRIAIKIRTQIQGRSRTQSGTTKESQKPASTLLLMLQM
jgi:hypothetical protein